MKKFLTSLWAYRVYLIRGAILLVVLILIGLIWHGSTRPPRVIQLDPITKVIEVPVEKITEKTVTKYIRVEDRTAVKKLLAENKRLHADVQQLTIALANNISSGSGKIVYVPSPVSTSAVPQPFSFTDWRLNFTSHDGINATYALTQRFAVVNTVGRNEQNVPVNIIGLFEINEKGERVEIPLTDVMTVAAQPSGAKFYVKPTIQAGVAVLPGVSTSTQKVPTGFAITIPWLKRGTTRAVETTRYAYLSPAVVVNGKNTLVGVLPISVNLGTLKYMPFSDIWVSPFGGVNSTAVKQLGIVFSATF